MTSSISVWVKVQLRSLVSGFTRGTLSSLAAWFRGMNLPPEVDCQ